MSNFLEHLTPWTVAAITAAIAVLVLVLHFIGYEIVATLRPRLRLGLERSLTFPDDRFRALVAGELSAKSLYYEYDHILYEVSLDQPGKIRLVTTATTTIRNPGPAVELPISLSSPYTLADATFRYGQRTLAPTYQQGDDGWNECDFGSVHVPASSRHFQELHVVQIAPFPYHEWDVKKMPGLRRTITVRIPSRLKGKLGVTVYSLFNRNFLKGPTTQSKTDFVEYKWENLETSALFPWQGFVLWIQPTEGQGAGPTSLKSG